jgi:hypothetical protein
MKKLHTSRFAYFGALAASLMIVPDALFAQTPPPAALPSPAPVETPTPPRKGLSLRITAGTLAEAVDQLLQAAKSAQLPEINVIYGPGAAGVGVPELNIRNVSAADGVHLIATSAGCETEPILSAQDAGTVIGYKITQSASPGALGPAQFGSLGISAPLGGAEPGMGAQGGRPRTAKSQTAYPNASVPGVGMPGFPRSGALNITGDGRIVSMGLNPGTQSPAARVYPLGNVTTIVKFQDIEATLHDVLKAEGSAADSTKLALHEKTNVLVVTGPPRAHELVSQLLEALQKNQAAAESASGPREDFLRETTEMRVRLDAQSREKDRLEQQLAKSDAELRELTNELARVKASASANAGKPQ